MSAGILGRKLGMTQIFAKDGTVVPITVVQAGPCRILQVKVKDITELPEGHRTALASKGKKFGHRERQRRPDGYYALRLGFDSRPLKTTKKPEQGQCKRAGVEDGHGFYLTREIRWDSLPPFEQGQDLDLSILDGVKRVDVTGITKGRGWTGTIKRWNFRRQPMSHGAKKVHRHVGGTGRTYSTGKGIPKEKKSAGHYGVERVTVQNLEVVEIDQARNLLLIKGAVPGPVNGYLMIRKTVKAEKR